MTLNFFYTFFPKFENLSQNIKPLIIKDLTYFTNRNLDLEKSEICLCKYGSRNAKHKKIWRNKIEFKKDDGLVFSEEKY
jgi:hypothetical protein